jgi:hypothetical protein
MARYYHHVSDIGLLRSGKSPLKFCRDHGRTQGAVQHLENCVSALESNDIRAAETHFRKIYFGGMGGFGDWFPPVIYPHEDRDYVWAEFEALLERWYRLMSTATGSRH